MENRLRILVESRIRGDVYVRFGGGFLETYYSNIVRRRVSILHSGERSKLLNHIASEMRILRGIAYGMQRAMYWAHMRGIWASLNPWAEWQNMDVQIANSVLTEAKYLRR